MRSNWGTKIPTETLLLQILERMTLEGHHVLIMQKKVPSDQVRKRYNIVLRSNNEICAGKPISPEKEYLAYITLGSSEKSC